MIDLKGYRGFALRYQDHSKEASAIKMLSMTTDIPVVQFHNKQIVPEDLVPCGSVEWVQSLLGFDPVPNYYPDWVESALYRKIWYGNDWIMDGKVFVKPADKYKRFTGFVTQGKGYRGKKKSPYVYSDVVEFENEWRYYISNGKVLTAQWYWGDEINTPEAPELDIDIPGDICCAADFGTLPGGRLACVEVQHPFSCGWYGHISKDAEPYLQWVINGWEYMKNETIQP